MPYCHSWVLRSYTDIQQESKRKICEHARIPRFLWEQRACANSGAQGRFSSSWKWPGNKAKLECTSRGSHVIEKFWHCTSTWQDIYPSTQMCSEGYCTWFVCGCVCVCVSDAHFLRHGKLTHWKDGTNSVAWLWYGADYYKILICCGVTVVWRLGSWIGPLGRLGLFSWDGEFLQNESLRGYHSLYIVPVVSVAAVPELVSCL